MTDPVPSNTGHGHVFPRADGVKARCGGPAICHVCAIDLGRKNAQESIKAAEQRPSKDGVSEAAEIARSFIQYAYQEGMHEVGIDPIAVLMAKIERLTADLATANANHERFEREWYLRGDEIERLNADLAWIRRRTQFWGEVPQEEPAPSRELIDYGYAPGQYAGKCLDCMRWMDFVDKRCRVCKSCAEKRRDRATQPPRDE